MGLILLRLIFLGSIILPGLGLAKSLPDLPSGGGVLPPVSHSWNMWLPLGQFDEYNGLALGADGRMWIADQTGSALLVYDERGQLSMVPTGTFSLQRLVKGGDGNLYATTGYSPTIVRVSPVGSLSTITLGQPTDGGITTGIDGSIWVTEISEIGHVLPNGTVREYPLSAGDRVGGGSAITQQTNGSVWFEADTPGKSPYVAALDPKNGHIYKHYVDECGWRVMPLIAAPDGRVWAVCYGFFDGFEHGLPVKRVRWPANLDFSIVGGYDNAVVGPDKAIWIAGGDIVLGRVVCGAFVRFEPNGQMFVKYVAPLDYAWEAAFAFDRIGNIWAGTNNGQVQVLVLNHRPPGT